jgi:phosphoribosylanthranilate isomerase
MKVKVCGITSLDDAVMCEESGADALGFVHVRGRSRSLELDRVAEACSVLGPMTSKVLVCSPRSSEEAAEMFRKSDADILQLHSLEPDETQRLRDDGIRLIRAVSPVRHEALRFSEIVHAILFESGIPGTGTVYDYSEVPIDVCRRVIIAGGLTISNVDKALAKNPYALDVSSGVERSPGRKDPALVSEFIRRCKQ